ncbi:pep-cterm system histidine kinase [Alicycliphilus sp. B1]|nr:pep-cterm system histidine kinase [Alicycliphilus sp. B1]
MAGTFLFDLYLFSQGLLLQGLDPDALKVRPFVHALMVPLLLLATTRHRNWIAQDTRLAQGDISLGDAGACGAVPAFHGGGGATTCATSAANGVAPCSWGLVFVATVLAIAFVLSGSLRAKLRVFLGKHFFRYRFDYREEWLKFTATLSSQDQPQEAGRSVIRGPGRHVGEPRGCIVVAAPRRRPIPAGGAVEPRPGHADGG